MFRHTGARKLADLNRANVAAWCVSPPDRLGKSRAPKPANNTVRKRAHTAKAFLNWCHDNGHLDTADIARSLSRRGGPIAAYRPTYGKVQSAKPGRWLTHDEAYDVLVASVQDGTVVGLRDELIVRLGLLGMRASEIRQLVIGDLDLRAPEVRWTVR
jgi:integrase